MINELKVDLGERSYPIFIGPNLLEQKSLLTPYIASNKVMVVSNETVAPLYLDRLMASLQDYQADTVILPDGEEYKDLTHLNLIYDALLEKKHNRQTTLIALGGGVVGDMTGFAAASYQRGVNFIQIPTTLLAQVDSSVGGKTGVNHARGKNMIGAFHQPRCVLADIATLDTLDDRQFAAGMAEVIKYGLITDAEFFVWLETNISALMSRDTGLLIHAVERSCQDKADVVAADELEAGRRALLNLGHTFGHAIETGMGYGEWLHGEAVATGMLLAAQLSQRSGWLSESDVSRVKDILLHASLPITLPQQLSIDRMLELMSVDKKVMDGKLRLVLMKAIGHAIVTEDFNHADLTATLEQA